MAAPRLYSLLLVRSVRLSAPHSIGHFKTPPIPKPKQLVRVSRISPSRCYSQQQPTSKLYKFEEIKEFVERPNPNRILIDTREPEELRTTGTIPGALNIPVNSQPDSFFISAEEFEDRYGFDRPPKDKELVFYCKAGVRSRASAELARQAGWENIGEYPGSWLDWERNGGPSEKGGA
ncbi:Rhodanese-like domain-containing protein [Xylogone sp. PMI_703]|nr:Rhodanese-like domain-containing protein [Xylogone sp. PMI_703]